MAEIMILIVFCLLLLLNTIVGKKNEEIKKITEKLYEKEKQIAILTDKPDTVEQLNKIYNELNKKSFDDAFKELLLIKEQVNNLKQELNLLQEAKEYASKILNDNKLLKNNIDNLQNENTTLKYDIVSLHEKLDHIQELKELIEKYDVPSDEISDIIDTSMVLKEQLPDLFKDKEMAKELPHKLALLNQEIVTKDNRLTYLQKKMKMMGRGTERPACWADKSGKIEYIFQVALTSTGIITHDNKLPHRAIEQSELPLNKMSFEKELSDVTFRRSTKALFEWSEKNECRFFVKVFDKTKNDEKTIYKKRLRIVGEHFYYYEPLNDTQTWISQ